MDEDTKERLGDAAEGLEERGREEMKQHGDLGGTDLDDEAADKITEALADDPLAADPEDVELAIERLRQQAVQEALADDDPAESPPPDSDDPRLGPL